MIWLKIRKQHLEWTSHLHIQQRQKLELLMSIHKNGQFLTYACIAWILFHLLEQVNLQAKTSNLFLKKSWHFLLCFRIQCYLQILNKVKKKTKLLTSCTIKYYGPNIKYLTEYYKFKTFIACTATIFTEVIITFF